MKVRNQLRCSDCGQVQARWVGRCPNCGAWGAVQEQAPPPALTPRRSTAPGRGARPIHQVPLDAFTRAATGIGELDRVLGGGFVPGSVTLLGGEPGAGKSTLLLQALQALACKGHRVLYLSAEESAGQVRLRAERLEALHDRLLLAAETDLGVILDLLETTSPDVVVLDSIQTIFDPEAPGGPGSLSQVRDCAQTLVRTVKSRDWALVLVGHVTKEGQLAGPRVLEHLVDTVAELEGDRHHALRLLRAVKNRFGPAGEVGCFEMMTAGLRGVDDAGRLFVGEAATDAPGVVVTLALEGRRPLACEVQALVAETRLVNPRRVASGLDSQRLALLVAVLGERAGVRLGDRDVFVSSVGGLRLSEPAVDLALCLAVASSRGGAPVRRGLVVLGEIGLAGEVRLVTQIERRLAEAARLGFGAALVPAAYHGPTGGLRLHHVTDLRHALAVALG